MQVIYKYLAYETSDNKSFEINKARSNDVIKLHDFTFTYPNETVPLFEIIPFTVHRSERIALIGKNGVGKTTLLNEITKHNPQIEVGANVEIGYYDQEQALLSKKNTVLEEVWSEFSHIDEKDIRSI